MSAVNVAMLWLAATAALAVSGASGEPRLPQSGPSTFDVAGVRLGMTPQAVRAALGRAGYVVGSSSETFSFEVLVSAEVAARLRRTFGGDRRSVGSMGATGPNQESLSMTFSQWPAGPRLASALLTVPEERQAVEDFEAQVARKYGPRSIGLAAKTDQWCTQGDPKCTLTGQPELPSLIASYYGRQIKLQLGRSAEREREGLLKKAADSQVPPSQRTAF